MQFDPDEDGFDFNHQKALLLHNNMNLLQFIRKNLGIGQKSKQFEQGLDQLVKKTVMPEFW